MNDLSKGITPGDALALVCLSSVFYRSVCNKIF